MLAVVKVFEEGGRYRFEDIEVDVEGLDFNDGMETTVSIAMRKFPGEEVEFVRFVPNFVKVK
jgi:hypothetical protein